MIHHVLYIEGKNTPVSVALTIRPIRVDYIALILVNERIDDRTIFSCVNQIQEGAGITCEGGVLSDFDKGNGRRS